MTDWKGNADTLEAIAAGVAIGVNPAAYGNALRAIANDIRQLAPEAPAAASDQAPEAEAAPAMPEDPNTARARYLEDYFKSPQP